MTADFDAALTAGGTWALVAVTLAAVVVGWRAAKAANATLRLEAEPRIVVRVSSDALIFARQGMQRVTRETFAGAPPQAHQIKPLEDCPVFLVDGKLGADGIRKVADGFAIRTPTDGELYKLESSQASLWPALRLEIRNVGRSPAVQVGLKWNITAPIFNPDRRARFDEGPAVIRMSDETATVIDAVGPNSSTYVWLGNTTGCELTLTLKSPGYQLEPLNPESGRTRPISTIPTSTFRLLPSDRSV